jgi:hypothetical protein
MSDNEKYLEAARLTRKLYRLLRRELKVPHGWSKDMPSLARLLDRCGKVTK